MKAHPVTEDVGTVWGFGDLSSVIQTHRSVSFLSDWEDMGDRLVGIWVRRVLELVFMYRHGVLEVSPNYQDLWGQVRRG